MMKKILILSLFALFLSCGKESPQLKFTTIHSEESGIDFINTITNTPTWNALNYLYFYTGAGVAAGDFNGDGYNDLYFVGNQTEDRLYINKKGLHFEDASAKALPAAPKGWSSGVTSIDINGDGLLDIYISRLGKHMRMRGKNQLLVNQGNDKDGIPKFKEEAAKYHLDLVGFNHQAAFMDYDLDGDLDVYILQYSVNPSTIYVDSKKRQESDSLAGGKFLINDNGTYRDITKEAGIYSSSIGFGLGVAVSDINDDGYPDIYVSNDFFENDYLYINQKDGTFKDLMTQKGNPIKHTSNFSMGNDIADVNNDGNMDILTLDMLPDDLETRITSESDISFRQYQAFLKRGYHPQFIHNSLQLNTGDMEFSDVSFQSGIAATDWSWAGLFADFDNDGFKDLFITSGIYGATNDKDFVDFMATDIKPGVISDSMDEKDLKFVEKLPKKHTPNYLYKNEDGLHFKDMDGTWFAKKPSYSNGAIYDDLDRDGQLDLVINNVNEPATLMHNNGLDSSGHYIDIQFEGLKPNTFGLGAKVIMYKDTLLIKQENYTAKGYLSAIAPELHFGLGDHANVDSLIVIWPGNTFQKIENVKADQLLTLKQANASGDYYISHPKKINKTLLAKSSVKITFRHFDNNYNAFDQEPLIPYMLTNEGPTLSVVDYNGDGLDDIFMGSGPGQTNTLFLQTKNGDFNKEPLDDLQRYAPFENTAQLFVDADDDGDQDLILAQGGQEASAYKQTRSILYFRNEKGVLTRDSISFKNIYPNASVLRAADYDGDGDMDVFLGASIVPGNFGADPIQYLFNNDGKGNFTAVTQKDAPGLENIGMIMDARWMDLDGDNKPELIVAGHWMAPQIFKNQSGTLSLVKNTGMEYLTGFWECLQTTDINGDGLPDLVAGNWGLNSILSASAKAPLRLYRNDFNGNGKIEPVMTYVHQGRETPFNSKNELVKQIPQINKKYLSFDAFAKADLDNLLGSAKLKSAQKKTVTTLASTYFINKGNFKFEAHHLPEKAQISSTEAILPTDLNGDGKIDLILGGNFYQLNLRLGRFDAFRGMALINNGKGGFEKNTLNLDVNGEVRSIKTLKTADNKELYLFGINNDSLQVLSKNTP